MKYIIYVYINTYMCIKKKQNFCRQAGVIDTTWYKRVCEIDIYVFGIGI